MKVIEQEMIDSQEDLVKLGIIDWNRLNGTSLNMAEAMRDISGWLIGSAVYTVAESDLTLAPQRDDFPEWGHEGNAHMALARLFWNDFKYHHPTSELILVDEPDFYGTLKSEEPSPALKEDRSFYWSDEKGHAHFWGDIGQVSASAFALTVIRKMKKGDIWISVLNEKQQVVIEATENLQQKFYKYVAKPLMGPITKRKMELIHEMKRGR